MDSLAYLCDQSQVFGPARVNVAQRDCALGLARNLVSETIAQLGVAFGKSLGAQPQLRFARECGHTPILERASLSFDQGGVAPERLSYLVILSLDDPLQSFDLMANRRMLDRLVLRSGAYFRRNQMVYSETRHQIILQADEEARRPRIALAARAPFELVVYAPALVTVRSDDVKTAQGDYALTLLFSGPAKTNVRAPARHVGRDGHRVDGAGLGDDLGLGLVVLRIEDATDDSDLAQLARQCLGLFDTARADQNGTPRHVRAFDLCDERQALRVFVREDQVRQVFADARTVRRDRNHFEAVESFQLFSRWLRCGGHSAEPGVMLQEMLQGDRTQDAPAGPYRQPFFSLQRRLQAVGPAPVVHHAPGEFIHQFYAPIAHDVINIAPQQRPRVQRLIDLDQQQVVFGGVQIPTSQRRFHTVNPALGERDVSAVLVGLPVFAFGGRGHYLGDAVGTGLRPRTFAGDHQRYARLVNEDRIGFVNDREVEGAMDQLIMRSAKSVAQEIEAGFFGGGVSDIGGVGRPASVNAHAFLNGVDAQTQEAVDRPHPCGVAAGEIVVESQHVNATTGARIQTCRRHSRQSLALAGLHLDELSATQRNAGHHLDVERPHAQHSSSRFPRQREDID